MSKDNEIKEQIKDVLKRVREIKENLLENSCVVNPANLDYIIDGLKVLRTLEDRRK